MTRLIQKSLSQLITGIVVYQSDLNLLLCDTHALNNWSTHDKHVQAFMTSTRLDRVQSNSVRYSSSDWQNCNSTHITRIVTQACCVKWLLTSITWTVLCPIIALIKRIAKFSNVIGCHQPDLSTNRTVSCFLLDSVIRQLKGQLTRHACVSEQNASWTVVQFAE